MASAEGKFVVGVALVRFRLRHATSLKDKRQATRSLDQRLRNLGFSVSEVGSGNDPKFGSLGFSIVSSSIGQARSLLDKGISLCLAELEVLQKETELFDYSESMSDGELLDFTRD